MDFKFKSRDIIKLDVPRGFQPSEPETMLILILEAKDKDNDFLARYEFLELETGIVHKDYLISVESDIITIQDPWNRDYIDTLGTKVSEITKKDEEWINILYDV